jgi:hypothetical protein
MPLSIPAFDQYQSPMFPLRGLWNKKPPEGDFFVNAEINWLVTTKSQAVQFSLSGNSPVSMSQIVALSVDNSRSGADVDFVFPDSGFVLTVPGHNQLVAPVFTNALMFYAVASGAIAGDTTVFQILNSMPPPVPIAPSTAQNHAAVSGVSLVNSTTIIVPASISGTLNSITVTVDPGSAIGICQMNLTDGTGATLWVASPSWGAGGPTIPLFTAGGLSVRFSRGLNLVVTSASGAPGLALVNVYYSTP